MRQIKFRARNANLPAGWVYGYFIIENNRCAIINDEGRFQVIADTEAQFTGLLDKNGVPIYEGDIVKGLRGQIIEITWSNYPFVGASICEVIGNIYEHPALLKGGK